MSTSAIIDKLTNSIERADDGKNLDTEILPLKIGDLKIVLKKVGWLFNWREEFKNSNRQVYKLMIKCDDTIQGLISLQVMDGYIEMHLIESAPQNIGKKKKFIGVAGNLVAFACKVSFDLGLNGFIAFTAKTELIKHYEESLGAEVIFRNRMTVNTNSAIILVNSYYEGYFNQ